MGHRVGLVGLKQARRFIEIFNAMPDTRVTALCDVNENLLDDVGDEAGIDKSCRFADLERMLDTDIDIVELSTPIQIHGKQSIEAMKKGKHVLCQYIAASTQEEAEELKSVAVASGKKYMFIETNCYERKNMILRKLCMNGILGELTMGRGHYIHDTKKLLRSADGSLTWRGELRLHGRGGALNAVHTAALLIELFGERVTELYSYGPGSHSIKSIDPRFNWHDRVTTVGYLSSGRTLELVTDVASYRPVNCGYIVQGTKGCFDFDRAAVLEDDAISDWKDLQRLESDFSLTNLIKDHSGHDSAFNEVVKRFIGAVDNDTAPSEDLSLALHITAIGWAAEESLASGKRASVAM